MFKILKIQGHTPRMEKFMITGQYWEFAYYQMIHTARKVKGESGCCKTRKANSLKR